MPPRPNGSNAGGVGDRLFTAIAGDEGGVIGQAVNRASGEHVIHRDDRLLARLFVDDAKNFPHGSALGFVHSPAGELLRHRI